MDVVSAQVDLSRAYVGGGPGVVVSSLVWFAAALIERRAGVETAFIALFLAGMLIFPLGTLMCRFLFKRERESPANPLGGLALESTIAMIGCLLAAWLFLPFRPELVFPVAAIAVGTHYAVFRTIYGDRLFWLLAGLITAVGLVAIFDIAPIPAGNIFAVGVIELLFGLVLTMRAKRAFAR